MGGVVNIFVGQIKGDNLTVAGVNANVQLVPGAALCPAMFFKQPFAGAAQFQSGTIDEQVKFARSNLRRVANRQSTRPPAQRRMIGNRQVDLQHFHDGSDQAFALAKRQSKHGAQCQRGFDGQIGIMALSARRRTRLRLPTGDRCGREPNYQAPAITQGCIIFAPVRDPMTLAGNIAAAFRIKLERQDPLPT